MKEIELFVEEKCKNCTKEQLDSFFTYKIQEGLVNIDEARKQELLKYSQLVEPKAKSENAALAHDIFHLIENYPVK